MLSCSWVFWHQAAMEKIEHRQVNYSRKPRSGFFFYLRCLLGVLEIIHIMDGKKKKKRQTACNRLPPSGSKFKLQLEKNIQSY